MRNPLIKRIPREFKSDLGKYAVIFLFMVMLISLVSGFLVADNSLYSAYENGFTKYNIEDGHMTFNQELPEELVEKIEKQENLKLYPLQYFEEDFDGQEKTSRVYINREVVNIACLMEGNMPEHEDEIAIDRMFAKNNDIKVGDSITLNQKKLLVCGLVALPDYSCLYENNSDIMFDALNFNVGIMTESGWNHMESKHISYNYAWKYSEPIDREDKITAKEKSDQLIESLISTITEYDMSVISEPSKMIDVKDYIPAYLNKAIYFTGEDMSGDKAMFLAFDYIVIVILAFIFAVTTLNTIDSEAKVIGTLRASGYSRKELTVHYLILPVFVTIIAGIIGNILGYTVFKDMMASLYYNSYSLPTYEVLWNGDAFVETTVVPIILMLFINLLLIRSKMKLSPLQFLRRELKKKPRKKAFKLNTKIPFIHRFRLRILFQNFASYLVMIFGIVLGAVVIIFGEMFGTIFKDYKAEVMDSMICSYQYILMEPVETENASAEKYCVSSFDFQYEDYTKDNISVYGVSDQSQYILADLTNGKTAISSSISKKYHIEIGDIIELKDTYRADESYQFQVDSIYDYDASLSVFVSRETYNQIFDKEDDYYTGYFSNEELTDLSSDSVLSVITEQDYTKLSDQMEHSMGDMMKLFRYFGVIMFVLIMYILSKQVIEKNFQSISMSKILGFKDSEIAMLYILSTSIVVLIGLFFAVPFTDFALRWIFDNYLYKSISGYFPYIIRTSSFLIMIGLGIVSYVVVSLLQFMKIRKIPKSEALKNVE